MEIKVLKKTSNELRLEIEGVGHTFNNILQKALLKDDAVDVAGYDIPHPLRSMSILYIRTKGTSKSETTIRSAVEKKREQNKEFGETFKKALRKWQRNPNSTTPTS
ncbi:MAG: DNA-directed RNA polymerase subunit L [Candidatus Bathyarchaeota archaeon]|nr:MAG: DNA-directed RNA polymerase subunit L [Candidatus Bathyarchaeota archaeon]